MDESHIRFIDNLIQESTLAVRVYLGCTVSLLSLALLLLLVSLLKPSLLPFERILAIIPTIFSAIPMPLFLMARVRRVALRFLKDEWGEAQLKQDATTSEKLKIRFEELRTKGLDKGWGPIQ